MREEIVEIKNETTPDKNLKEIKDKSVSSMKEIDLKSQLNDKKPKIFDLNATSYVRDITKNKYSIACKNNNDKLAIQNKNHQVPHIYSQEQLK